MARSPIPLHPIIHAVLSPAVAIACFFVTMRYLHRLGAVRALRRALLSDGVPVCLGCGYLLRGLRPEAGSCPECGQVMTPQARVLLAESSTAAEVP